MGGAVSISGFLLSRADWEALDAEVRSIFEEILSSGENRSPSAVTSRVPAANKAEGTRYHFARPRTRH